MKNIKKIVVSLAISLGMLSSVALVVAAKKDITTLAVELNGNKSVDAGRAAAYVVGMKALEKTGVKAGSKEYDIAASMIRTQTIEMPQFAGRISLSGVNGMKESENLTTKFADKNSSVKMVEAVDGEKDAALVKEFRRNFEEVVKQGVEEKDIKTILEDITEQAKEKKMELAVKCDKVAVKDVKDAIKDIKTADVILKN